MAGSRFFSLIFLFVLVCAGYLLARKYQGQPLPNGVHQFKASIAKYLPHLNAVQKSSPAQTNVQEDARGIASDGIYRAKVVIDSEPPAAEVFINGHPHGNLPLELLLAPATQLSIEVKHKGYMSQSRNLKIQGPETLHFKLQPESGKAGKKSKKPVKSVGHKVSSKKTSVSKGLRLNR